MRIKVKKLLLTSMIIFSSSNVIAVDYTESTFSVTDTYTVYSTCQLLLDGIDNKDTFGDVYTAKLTSNVKDNKKKISFRLSDVSKHLGAVTVVKADNESIIYKRNVSASSDVKFKMKSDITDLINIQAGLHSATVTVTANCG